jgi:hypothetical protein
MRGIGSQPHHAAALCFALVVFSQKEDACMYMVQCDAMQKGKLKI